MRRICGKNSRLLVAQAVRCFSHPIDEPVPDLFDKKEVKVSTRMEANKNPAKYTEKYNMVTESPDEAPAASGPFVQPPPIVDPTIVEFEEIESKLAQAERIDRVPAPSVLSQAERESLSRIIYVTHYQPGRDVIDRSDMFAATAEVRWMEEHFLELHRGDIEKTLKAVRLAVLERSDLKKPLSYIIGSQPFFGCDILVRKPLLCPRPETEWWTHEVVVQLAAANKSNAPLRILDMCAGTGCIGIAMAKNLPNATVVAADISKDAVLCANANAVRNKVKERYTCIHSDMFSNILPEKGGAIHKDLQHLGPLENSFDIIVSNPPYILPQQFDQLPDSVQLWESRLALVGDEKREAKQFLYYKEIVEAAPRLLKPRKKADDFPWPSVVMEVGLQAEAVAAVLDRYPGWSSVQLLEDFAREPRIVTGHFCHEDEKNELVKGKPRSAAGVSKQPSGFFSSLFKFK